MNIKEMKEIMARENKEETLQRLFERLMLASMDAVALIDNGEYEEAMKTLSDYIDGAIGICIEKGIETPTIEKGLHMRLGIEEEDYGATN